MRTMSPLALLVVLTACGSDGPPLHERQAFAGEVELRAQDGDAADAVTGRLAFQRASGNLQFTVEKEGAVVTLVRDAEGQVRAFQETVWRDPTEAEVARYRMVEGVVKPPAEGTGFERTSDGYAVQVDGRRIEVCILSEAAPTHGGR